MNTKSKSNQGSTGRTPLQAGPPPPRGAVKRGRAHRRWDHEQAELGWRRYSGGGGYGRSKEQGRRSTKTSAFKPAARRFSPPVYVVVLLEGNEKVEGLLTTWGRWLKLKVNNGNTLLVNPRYVKTVEFLRNNDGEANDHGALKNNSASHNTGGLGNFYGVSSVKNSLHRQFLPRKSRGNLPSQSIFDVNNMCKVDDKTGEGYVRKVNCGPCGGCCEDRIKWLTLRGGCACLLDLLFSLFRRLGLKVKYCDIVNALAFLMFLFEVS